MSMWRRVNPASSGSGNLVHQVDVPNAGDRLNHFGRNTCSACLLVDHPVRVEAHHDTVQTLENVVNFDSEHPADRCRSLDKQRVSSNSNSTFDGKSGGKMIISDRPKRARLERSSDAVFQCSV